jgi:DNA-binding Lrp family transcriptional regulator
MRLDRIDVEILATLQNNARLSNKELAAVVGLAPSSCLERVRALGRDGVLKGHHAEVAPSALGIGVEALVAVRLLRHSRDQFRTLYNHLLSRDEVLGIFHVSGANDLQVHVAVRDIPHLRDLIVEQFAGRPEVEHCETAVIFDLHRKHRTPCYLPSVAADQRPRRRGTARKRRARG